MADEKLNAYRPSGFGNWVPTEVSGTLTASCASTAAIVLQHKTPSSDGDEQNLSDEEMDAFIDEFSEN